MNKKRALLSIAPEQAVKDGGLIKRNKTFSRSISTKARRLFFIVFYTLDN